MNAQKKENIRTQKTCALIRKTFREMLIEMDYNQISIKKLTERADINRRTFYLHYGSIDELLNELIDEIADGYIKMTNSLNGYYDQREIARAFLLYFAQQDELHEKIICNSNFKYISDRINRRISDINQGHIDDLGKVSPYLTNIIIAYLNMSCLGMYRRWVADKKRFFFHRITLRVTCVGKIWRKQSTGSACMDRAPSRQTAHPIPASTSNALLERIL